MAGWAGSGAERPVASDAAERARTYRRRVVFTTPQTPAWIHWVARRRTPSKARCPAVEAA